MDTRLNKEILNNIRSFSKTLNVLYVEDNELARESTLLMLNNFFDHITIAQDGSEGLEKFNDSSFDLILTDIKMPNIDGIKMVENIRQADQNIPIVVLSAHNEVNYFTEMIKLNVNGFLLKPIVLDQFINTIYEVVNKLNLQTQNDNYKKNLENLVEQEIKRREEQEILLAQTSKMAAVGEMVDSIAHQWMQPLSVIKVNLQAFDIFLRSKEKIENLKKLYSFMEIADNQIDHLSATLIEFRNFFREGKTRTNISVKSLIDSIIVLLKDTLIKNCIETHIDIDEKLMINVISNEFKHIFINLINNSKDAFNENETEGRFISFRAFKDENGVNIEVSDNAGSISEDNIENIFKSNWTTKSNGTGIGLYMSKLIANKNNADITVKNIDKGVKFTVTVKN